MCSWDEGANSALTDPVTKYIPQLKQVDGRREKDKFSRLLNPRPTRHAPARAQPHERPEPARPKLQQVTGRTARRLKTRAAEFGGPARSRGKPGDKYATAIRGMNVAARCLVEVVSAMPYEEFLPKGGSYDPLG